MAGKPIHFLRNSILESLGKGNGKNHGHHADSRCRHRKPDDKSGKGMLPVKSNSAGYKRRKTQ